MVVLSGGQDSTTCLFWAKQEFEEVEAITFDYGQRHAREITAARKVAQLAKVPHEVIAVGPVLRSRSPLTDPAAELETYSDFTTMDAIIGDRVELTFVPMRNAFFLTLAANIAVSKDCFDVVAGVCEADNANYPDCRAAFVNEQVRTICMALGLRPDGFRVHAPLLTIDKMHSVKLARTLPGCWDALGYSHTCYAGDFPPCGQCHACVLRAHGFEEAGELDPLVQRARSESAVPMEVG
jgi:7-cyano-7-deazaguanine synthase